MGNDRINTHTIFISYGRKDADEFVSCLSEELKKRGFNIWRDIDSLVTRHPWDTQIETAINDSDVVIAVLTPWSVRRAGDRSNIDSVCLDELAYAKFGPNPKPIIPIMAIATTPPLFLFRSQWIDFINSSPADVEHIERIEKLTIALNKAINDGESLEHRFEDLNPLEFDGFLAKKREGFVGRGWLFGTVCDQLSKIGSPMMLIVGEPGRGKSSFIAEWILRNPNNTLRAFHVCRARDSETLDPARFIRSIAAMLAASTPAYEKQLAALQKENGPLSVNSCRNNPIGSFERGVIGPFSNIASEHPAVIVVDGLDEATDASGRHCIADLLESLQDLECGSLKFVVTSRKSNNVLQAFGFAHIIDLDDYQAENKNDVAQLFSDGGIGARTDQSISSQILNIADGNFLVARLVYDDWLRTGDICQGRGVASLFAFYNRAFRARFGKYNLQSDYKPIRTLLGIICEAGEPLEIRSIKGVLGYNEVYHVIELIKLIEPFAVTTNNRVAIFHYTFVEWLHTLDNPFGIDLENSRKLLAKASETGLTRMAYAWQPELGAKATHMNSAALYGLEKCVFDHLAAADRLLDSDGDDSLIAIGLIVRVKPNSGRTWPTAVVPPFLSSYLNKIIDSKNIVALLQLVAGIARAVKAFYFDGGVYLESPPGSGRWSFSSKASGGNEIHIAFHLSGAAAGMIGNLSKHDIRTKELLQNNKAQVHKILDHFEYMAYIAGGFSHAGWGHSISGYFEDSGLSIYSDLRDSIMFLSSFNHE